MLGQKKTILYKQTGGGLTKQTELNYSKPINPNLLDNPDFKINQRCKSEYSSTVDICTCDRWRATGIVKVLDEGGIEWTHLGSVVWDNGGRYCDVVQFRPSDGVYESQKLVTLSACVNGQVYSVTGRGAFSQTFVIDGHQIELIAWHGPTYRVRTYGEEDYTITISWVKLELGGVVTPFVPPDPAVELLKCQRYYQKFVLVGGGIYFPGVFDENVIDISVPLIEQMRVLPTLNFKDITKFICISSHNDILTFSDAVIYSYTYNTITIRLTRNYTEGEVLRGSCVLRATDHNYLELSADL